VPPRLGAGQALRMNAPPPVCAIVIKTSWIVVYGNKIIRTDTNADTGEASGLVIPFMNGYNVEQIDGSPEWFRATNPDATPGPCECCTG
jgi:hypothetical protein